MQRRGRAKLFWALRGGGWDLGVVSGFEFRAHPIGPEVYLLFLTYPRAEARQVLVRLRELMDDASREASAQAVYMKLIGIEGNWTEAADARANRDCTRETRGFDLSL